MTVSNGWKRMRAVARAEFILIRRNTTVLIAAAAVPLAMTVGTVLLSRDADSAAAHALALALLITLVLGMGTYMTSTLTLTARREDLYLKRLRTSEASDVAILCGLTAPTVVAGVIQLAVAFSALTLFGNMTLTAPLPVMAGTVLMLGMVVAAAVATTGVVNSTDQADSATLPFFTFLVLTALWSAFEPDGMAQRFLPGGALMATARASVQDDPAAVWPEAVPGLLALAAWFVLFLVLASRSFRWEPRR